MQSKNVLVRNMAFRGRIGKTKLVRIGGNARIFSEMQRGARASRGHFGTTIPNQLFKVEKNVRMNLLVFSKLKGNSRQRLKPMQVASQLGVNLSQLGVLRGYILPLFKKKDKRSLLSELFTSSR
ncbi:MAG: hypothetical protein NTY48_03660, partial [Candidatus Diapherotrites archaeon]|nr:hypothetical protein [Candidatus Diapherotrites archaeon]